MTKRVTSANYDAIAKAYNLITDIISQGGNRRAQQFFLDHIDPQSRILTIGCGSVHFNEDLAARCKNVVFVDISPKMLSIAKQNIVAKGYSGNFKFICIDITQYLPPEPYDVVLANFFLNTFAWNDCVEVLHHIVQLVKMDGKLCIADEVAGTKPLSKLEQKLLRPFITWVHHLWVRHPMHPIYNYTPILKQLGFQPQIQHRDPSNYIMSTIYTRTPAVEKRASFKDAEH